MTKRTEIASEELHAYIDDELDARGRASVEAARAADPALNALIAQYRADKAQLRAICGTADDEPLPQAWIDRIENSARSPRWRTVAMPALALAASFVLVFALTIAFRQSAAPAKGDLVAEALAARVDAVGPRTIIAVHSIEDAQVQGSAMTRVLATHVKVPDLSRMGYQLVGIKSYDSPSHSFELVYRDGNARIFTLYLSKSSGAPRFDQFAQNGLRVCIWQDDQLGAVMAGKMSAAEMQHLASLAYVGLTL
jgi:anti-sigma factor RsiW